MINFDLKIIPFSRNGSYFAFTHIPRPRVVEDNLYLKTVHGNIPRQVIFRLSMIHNGAAIPFTEDASPYLLHLESDYGEIHICITEPQLIRLRGTVGLRLHLDGDLYETAYAVADNRCVMNSSLNLGQYMMSTTIGNMRVEAPWDGMRNEHVVFEFLPGPDGDWEAAIEEFKGGWRQRDYPEEINEQVGNVEQEFETWLSQQAALPDSLSEARKLAAYITWSCMVAPAGHLKRPTMYMSKNWMTNVWSWDHCFNALAQVYGNPDLAWDQMMVMFDQQHETGALPDVMNDNGFIWNFCKPPVHGWALRRMMAVPGVVTPERLAEIYEPLCRWTNWWFDYRDDNHNGLPEYSHGNDSGWDNATIFAEGVPVESPDLAAYLVLQMDVLADVAHRLGKPAESALWKTRADQLLEKMLAEFWQGDHFVARMMRSQKIIETESLILFQPLILGNRLPAEISRTLVNGLKQPGRFLTEHGWASESLASPYYVPDGYWRGAIWAAPTLLLVDGLTALGETDFARDISRRFCKMAAASGMAENYDARTGAGLRDRAYSWTSSVFLILGHEHLLPA